MRASTTRHRMAVALSVVIAAALGATACGAGAGSGAEPAMAPIPDQLAAQLRGYYDAAKAHGETEVIVYGSGVSGMSPVWDLFMKRYPDIKVRTENLVGAPLITKLQQEQASGNHVADLVNTAGSVHQGLQSYYAPLDLPAGTDVVNIGAQELGGKCLAPFGTAFSVAYNTRKVQAGEAPTAWQDLVDPRWNGKIVTTDPTAVNATTGTLAVLHGNKVIDDAWLAAFLKQGLVTVADSPQVDAALASGQAEIGLTSLQNATTAQNRGAPEKFVFPFGGGSYINGQVNCLMSTAPHPDAAKLLHAWMFTPEAQAAAAAQGSYPLVKGVAGPAGMPSIDKVGNLVSLPQDKAAQANTAMAQKAAALLGR